MFERPVVSKNILPCFRGWQLKHAIVSCTFVNECLIWNIVSILLNTHLSKRPFPQHHNEVEI